MTSREEQGSRRPDGTYRKTIRIREGYVAPEEVKKYTSPMVSKASAEATHASKVAALRPTIPGLACSTVAASQKGSISSKLNISKPKCKPSSVTNVGSGKVMEGLEKSLREVSVVDKVGRVDVHQQSELASKNSLTGTTTAGNTGSAPDYIVLSPEEVCKKLKQLNKKLRQVLEVVAKIDKGEISLESLSPEQQEKISKKTEIEAEIAALEKL